MLKLGLVKFGIISSIIASHKVRCVGKCLQPQRWGGGGRRTRRRSRSTAMQGPPGQPGYGSSCFQIIQYRWILSELFSKPLTDKWNVNSGEQINFLDKGICEVFRHNQQLIIDHTVLFFRVSNSQENIHINDTEVSIITWNRFSS